MADVQLVPRNFCPSSLISIRLMQAFVSAGHQAVLCGCRAGGVEVRHPHRPVRHPDHHPGRHLCEHQEEGGLADGQAAGCQLHGGCHARRHAPEGARCHHGRLQVWHWHMRSPPLAVQIAPLKFLLAFLLKNKKKVLCRHQPTFSLLTHVLCMSIPPGGPGGSLRNCCMVSNLKVDGAMLSNCIHAVEPILKHGGSHVKFSELSTLEWSWGSGNPEAEVYADHRLTRSHWKMTIASIRAVCSKC